MRWLFALLLVACASEARSAAEVAARRPSNILAEDYIGPAACGECHAAKYAGWRQGLHRTMNQLADEAVIGDFDTSLSYAGQTLELRREGGRPVMIFAGRTYRVTRTIGTRYLQEYVGSDGGPEIRLPFAWWIRPGGWFPRAYFDSWYGEEYQDGKLAVDPFQADHEAWDTRCVWCHNTFPFELRVLRPGVGRGLEQFYELADSRRPLRERIEVAVLNRLPTKDLVTVGISCESCHLGGRDHADGGDISFTPISNDLVAHAELGGRQDPRTITTICAQCHSTPSDSYPDGGATRNSSEALSMAAGACVSQLRCTSCHDPHGPPRPVAASVCTESCHTALAEPRLASAHSRHRETSCLDCHMPMITQGVSGLSRTHRISSPAEPVMLASEAPQACNLCHLDRPLAWTVAELARGWNVRVDPGFADLTTPAGQLYLKSPSLSTRLAAAAAYGRQGQPSPILPLLDAPVAYERMYLFFALEDALGRKLRADEYDPLASPTTRAAQAKLLRSRP